MYRRSQSQKAWTSGTNPLTQRAPAASQQNGNVPQPRPAPNPSKPSAGKDGGLSDKHSHDRLRYLLVGAIVSLFYSGKVSRFIDMQF